ncbi:MAG: hypothetical protein ACO3RB_07840 [Ilumatobacteraceae bacterium]
MHPGHLVATNMVVNVIGGGLIILGLVLVVVTLAFWRSAVEDPSVLAPLEVMGDRRFARAADERRVDILNSVRPDGAEKVSAHVALPVLVREPASEPERPFRDPFPHDDDAIDVVERPRPAVPDIIDPLLNQRRSAADDTDAD